MSVTTLAIVKADFGVTGTGDDAIVQRMIDAVAARFDRACNRTLLRAVDKVERHDGGPSLGGGRGVIGPLKALPIESVAEVKEDTNPVDFAAATALTVEEDYYFDAGSGLIHRLPLDATWLRGRANVQVKYTGGYLAAGATPTGSQVGMPDDIILAATRQVIHWFRNRKTPGVESVSLGRGSEFAPTGALLDDVQAVLASYRRMTM